MARNEDPHGTRQLKDILGISDTAMDHAMAMAYQLYLSGRFAEAEVFCKGLIACDPHYWWSHSLHASVLRRMGRHEEALTRVEDGLSHEPGQPKLLLMRSELRLTIARNRAADVLSTQSPLPVRPGALEPASSDGLTPRRARQAA